MPRTTTKVEGIEVLDDTPDIETVSASKDMKKLIDDEAFMNEMVEVVVHESTREDEPNHIVLSVNGRNMPVIRGVPTRMRRMYVEVLARMKETRYSQKQDAVQLDNIQFIPRTALVYPFTVTVDSNDRGRAWLQNVIAEAS